MKSFEILAAFLAGAGAVAGQATESLGPLLAGLLLAGLCQLLGRFARLLA